MVSLLCHFMIKGWKRPSVYFDSLHEYIVLTNNKCVSKNQHHDVLERLEKGCAYRVLMLREPPDAVSYLLENHQIEKD